MIKLTKIHVEGFRLLEKVDITIEEKVTVIVGRNNSGKTSLTEVLDKFLGEQVGKFRLEDFSSSTRSKFLKAKEMRDSQQNTPDEILATLPVISLELTFTYDVNADDLGFLSPFIIDLDPECTESIARIEFSPSFSTLTTLLDIPATALDNDWQDSLFRHLHDAIPKAYTIKTFAIDPTDARNTRNFENREPLSTLLYTGFVRAQRTLDMVKLGDTDVIGKLLNKLFKTANMLGATPTDQAIAEQLKASVAQLETSMQGDFDQKLKELLPALNSFGFPSLNDTELIPKTNINVESLLTDNTRILYTSHDGVHLPEGYNGLGTRNLIYILLQLETLHKAYRSMPKRPSTHLVFIEEPEAHLHPQMQEVFIAQLNEAIITLSQKYPNVPAWPVQFIISTHSSHLANAATFDAIRYFLNEPSNTLGMRKTKVKDFREGAELISSEDKKFIQQYMTLTKCDLYFADKAILVEGTTERILMPRIIKYIDKEVNSTVKLGSQYITTIEIGGAYAEKFYPLLEYLELKTLIITDIDAVWLQPSQKNKEKNAWVACPCSQGERTSNKALKSWFNDENEISVQALMSKTAEDKTIRYCRIAYQIPEDGSTHCARSYEDALILANLNHFDIADDENAAENAWEVAKGFKKSEDAIRFAVMEEDWNVPNYIREGLIWLSEPPSLPTSEASLTINPIGVSV